ncbi:hypothetical protein L1857_10335 [Amycolatopsis thermalba]|uniref:Uncharacterized protein n=1 Tax=Amycolatopsis thermalba TaxID=944492 RepID=A0ABY4NSX4_9PSEU|nr:MULTISPECIES: hypothetical protein [Amycolatopsis]UQS23184.1 hypothetical protein L1857_10335 [Amycolatopsis thermalba]
MSEYQPGDVGLHTAGMALETLGLVLDPIGGYLENAGKSMKVAGGLVGAFRGIVRDLIAMLLATIIKGALIAAALAPVSFGASIVVFIGTTIGMVATALGKIGAKIAELTRKLVDLAGAKPPSAKPGSNGPAPDPKTHHCLSEQMSQTIKDELSEIEGVTPAMLERFDKISNFSVAQLGTLFGPAGAEKFEQAIKYLTDPWFGYRGLAGKTIIDMIKGIPTSVGDITGGDE